jgi:pyruvate dehydrogenase E2 component (dihydrolipoamide acetyltransferase)
MDNAHTVTALTPIRKVIATRMAVAKQTIPHFRIVADMEVDELMRLRCEFRAQRELAPVSLSHFVIKASAMALMDVPEVNIQWGDNAIRQYRMADIAVITALDDGLSTPIIRNADSKTVWDIASELRDLVSRARSHALQMDEICGGTFSISNLGMYDVDQFDAIVNPPQCAILAVGAAKPRIVLTSTGATRIATMMRLTLSVDHRAIDGVLAAKFVSALRRRLEQPDYLRKG